MSEHTPGFEWDYDEWKRQYDWLYDSWCKLEDQFNEEHEALVEALAWFDSTQDYGDCPPDWVTKARDAIRKVKGESE